jgi:hypothetical protein
MLDPNAYNDEENDRKEVEEAIESSDIGGLPSKKGSRL